MEGCAASTNWSFYGNPTHIGYMSFNIIFFSIAHNLAVASAADSTEDPFTALW
jgi:hypothetical protein